MANTFIIGEHNMQLDILNENDNYRHIYILPTLMKWMYNSNIYHGTNPLQYIIQPILWYGPWHISVTTFFKTKSPFTSAQD